jgi:aspartyl-tRNA(Asn)/glutamyl-tRNA(Gln) amidotransferase subunit C
LPIEIDIDHVARLARLELTPEERERLRIQLSAILDHAAAVGEVATGDVPPTARAIPLSNVYRPDEPGVPFGSIPREEALANAPEREDDRFKVPRIAQVE